jgi:APA family basic amino acid/polyamine antiporter
MCLLVLDPGLTSALAVGIASYAANIFPLSAIAAKALAVVVIWGLCILNILSIAISAGFLRWTTWLKLGLLGFLVVWALSLRLGSWSNFVPFIAQRAGSLPLAPALGAAMVGAFFSFGGWWDVSKIAGEVPNPGRTLPHAMLIGVLIVTLVYAMVSAVFLYLVPLRNVTSDETFVAQAGAVLFGHAGAVVFSGIVIVCVFSSIAALIMSAPRVYYAMAQDGLFLHSVAAVHPRFDSPARAILIQGVIASALVAIGNFQQIIAYFMFIAIVFLAMAGAAVFIARSRQSNSAPAFLTPVYPLPPVMFLFLIFLLLILLALRSPRQAMLGTAVVLTGLPVYKLFQRCSNAEMMHRSAAVEEI